MKKLTKKNTESAKNNYSGDSGHETDNLKNKPDDSHATIVESSSEKPEVYNIKKGVNKNKSRRRDFIANSILAGAAVSLGAGQLSGCKKDRKEDDDTVVQSIYSISTQYWYAGFLFSRDGKTIASYGSAEPTVNLWSIPGGNNLKALENAATYPGIRNAAFSYDGKLLVIHVYTKINIWSIPDGLLLKTIEEEGLENYQISQVEISPIENTVAYIKYPETSIKICSVPDGTLLKTIDNSGGSYSYFQFNPDGRTIAFNIYPETSINVYSIPDGVLLKTISDNGRFSKYFQFSPDGKVIASDVNGTISLYAYPEGNLLRTIVADPNYAFFEFSKDGKILASWGADSSIKLWSLADGSLLKVLSSHTSKVHNVCFSPDEITFASCQAETIILWTLIDGFVSLKNTITENVDIKTLGRYISFSPDGKTLASSYGSKISLWSIPDCTPITAGGCICDSVCTCDTVSAGNGVDICTCNTIGICTCNNICTCNAVSICGCDSHSSGYWFPN